MSKQTIDVEKLSVSDASKYLIPEINPAYLMPKYANDVAYDIAEGRKVLLTGHMGCGKTSLFEQLAAGNAQPVLRVNMNGQTTISDFVGFYSAKGGSTEWNDGALPLAMRNGYWLIIDEIDFAEPQILSVLNSVAEKDGKLFLKEKGHEVVVPHKRFRLLATANTVGIMEDSRHLYQGSNIMNRALLDRFRCYYVDYLSDEQEVEVLCNTVEGMTSQAADNLVRIGNEIRKGFKQETLSSTFSLRQLIDFAELLLRKREENKGRPESKKQTAVELVMSAAEIVILSKVSREDGEAIKGIISRLVPNNV